VNYGPSIASPSPWIFGASGLLFNRIDNEHVRLATNLPISNYAALSTSDAQMQATGGVQLSAGRYFGGGRFAAIGSYWGIYSNPQSVTVYGSPGDLRSNLPFTAVGAFVNAQPFGIRMPGAPIYDPINDPGNTINLRNVYSIYDNAFAQRLVRDNEFQNVELNFFSFALGGGARQPYAATGCGGIGGGRVHGGAGAYGSSGDPCGSSCGPSTCATPCGPTGPCAPWYGAQCSKLRLSMYGGVRWFRFRDSLEYAASATDNMFGTTDDDFYYRNNVTNDLVGFQLGSMANWCTGTRFNLYAGTNFGVYGNHANATTRAGTTSTTAETFNLVTGATPRSFDYSTTTNDVAILGEGNIGTGIRISRGWSANLGYRVIGVSGVATAVGQIPRDFSNGADLNQVNNDRSLILHGLVLGGMYNF